MPLGNTKAGKTTYLNNLIDKRNFLRSDTSKATAFFWRLKFTDQTDVNSRTL
jgi:GTPase Era involved in 16S rRNA processing